MSGASSELSGEKLRIGVDLGGTKIEFVALETDGRELQREPSRGPLPSHREWSRVALAADPVALLR